MKAAERHRLKQDKYAETVVTGIQWSRHHVIAVIAGAVVLLGVIGGILWMSHSRQQAQAAANETLSKIQRSEFLALSEKDTAREDAIHKVLAEYDALIQAQSGSPIAASAAFRAAAFLNEAEKPAEAAGYFERARDLAGAQPGLRQLAQRGLAESLESSGKFDEAIREYKALAAQGAKAGAAQQQAEACWDIGRCYEHLGNVEQAKVFYTQARELGGDSRWADLARFGLENLTRPKPKPIPAPAFTPDNVKDKVHAGMKLSEARKVLGLDGAPQPNTPPDRGIFDFDFDHFFVTLTTDGTEDDVVKEVAVTKDSLSVAQRQAKRKQEWSDWLKAHAPKPAETPKPAEKTK